MEANKIQTEEIRVNGFVGGMSSAIRTIESVMAEVASTNIPVLLIGESGTGKDMFARRIHALSRNCGEPLLRIACASMNAASLSVELGLNSIRAGGTPRNSGGSVLFDEISELDPTCQRNLLYALPEDQEEMRPGLISARLISTTRRNLDDEMRGGRFRRELYYRMNGVCLRLPPLRERREDIPLFVEVFLTKHAAELGRPRPSLSPRIIRMFLEYIWPGNIRELETVVKKIVVLGDEQLAIAELDTEARGIRPSEVAEAPGSSLKDAARAASREAERQLIMKALARTHWNRKRAAQQLQISYKSLLYKLKQIGLEDSSTSS